MSATRTEGLADRAAEAFAAYRDGDRERMRELVELLTPILWHLARATGLDEASAEDVVQDAWLKLVEKADSVSSPQAVLAWLSTTVRREAWRTYRIASRVVLQDEWTDDRQLRAVRDVPVGTSVELDPGKALVQHEEEALLWRHVATLNPRGQTLMRIVAFVDRPDYTVVSSRLDMPVGSIGPTRGRCLASLRRSLLAEPAWHAA